MGAKRWSLLISSITILTIIVATGWAQQHNGNSQFSPRLNERIDCYPDVTSKFSGYSKQKCLARGCLFDDAAGPGVMQCYLAPNYGYQLVGSPASTADGVTYTLKRNAAINSMFPAPIENLRLDVQYYTNDIIRFKLSDADQPRFEVRDILSFDLSRSVVSFRFRLHCHHHRQIKARHVNTNSVIRSMLHAATFSHLQSNVELTMSWSSTRHSVVSCSTINSCRSSLDCNQLTSMALEKITMIRSSITCKREKHGEYSLEIKVSHLHTH